MKGASGWVQLAAAYVALALLIVLQHRTAGRVPPLFEVTVGYWILLGLAWSALTTGIGWWALLEGQKRSSLPAGYALWAMHIFSVSPAVYAIILAVLLNAQIEALFLDALAAVLLPIGFIVASRLALEGIGS